MRAATLALLGLLIPVAWCASPTVAKTQVVPGEEHCVINVRSNDDLYMRQRPSSSSRVVATLRYGNCGIIVTGECRSSWCPIEDGHDAGWVNRRFISMVSPALYCVTGVARGDRLNLRAFPATTSRIVRRLPRNQCDIAFLPYATGSWQKVRVDGYEGWVNRRYVSAE
jgi:SH3-like domain-containing protein